MRAPISRSRRGLARAAWPLVQAFTILAMLAGMLAPLAPLASLAAAAQGVPLPPPLPAPDRVSLSGSFQTLLGCPADFDPSCPQTQLRDNRDGTWSAVISPRELS